MSADMTASVRFFLTGAPRSGTTYASDWISTAPNAYCVHEVLPTLRACPNEKRLSALLDFAGSASDRLGKPLQREFLNWGQFAPRVNPEVLGLKNPWIWTSGIPEPCLTEMQPSFLERCIIMLRHPYDMVASGFERGLRTRNWPGYSAEQHAELSHACFKFLLQRPTDPQRTLVIHHEDLLLEPVEVQSSIETFLGIRLTPFAGHERPSDYFQRMRESISRAHGVTRNTKRSLLSHQDIMTVRRVLGDVAEKFGYVLS